eukprot:UN29596
MYKNLNLNSENIELLDITEECTEEKDESFEDMLKEGLEEVHLLLIDDSGSMDNHGVNLARKAIPTLYPRFEGTNVEIRKFGN